MRTKFFTAFIVAALAVIPTTNSAAQLKAELVPSVFAELANAKTLANPALLLIDVNTGRTIYSKDAEALRTPASTMKLMSAFSVLNYLPPETTFNTEIYKTDLKNQFQIVGDFDPSITPTLKLSQDLKFVYSDRLVSLIRSKAKSHRITIRYYGITVRTKTNMDNTFRRLGYGVSWREISQAQIDAHKTTLITKAVSPNLANILNYTLLFSDNWVADYMAKIAAEKAGYGYSAHGIELVYKEVLSKYELNNSAIKTLDGSGLSHSDRISVRNLVDVLTIMNKDPKFESAISGLPVGGVSGTLQHRFIKTAPESVGLIRAKTGSINGVVALAGFIDSGEHEYAFAIIADHLRKSYASESAARDTIDKVLGKIAAPKVITPEVSESPVAENPGL